MAREARRAPRWAWLGGLYALLHLWLASDGLAEAAAARSARAIAAGTFSILGGLAAFGAVLTSARGGPRAGPVAALTLLLATLVDALLRALAGATACIAELHGSKANTGGELIPALARAGAGAAGVLILRGAAPVPRALRAHAAGALAGGLADAVASLSLPKGVAPLAALLAAAGTGKFASGMLRDTVRILAHATPPRAAAGLRTAVARVNGLPGVAGCSNVHLWLEAPGRAVATLTVRVRDDAARGPARAAAVAALAPIADDVTVQVETTQEVGSIVRPVARQTVVAD